MLQIYMNAFSNSHCYRKKNIVKILIKASHIILHILAENMNGYVNFIGICKGLKCKECKTF